jgi:radical SAM protein with 4Fe4S-binding SPASM domain
MGRTFTSINAYGDVYPCVQVPIPVGSVIEQPFIDIFHGTRMEAFARYPYDAPERLAECVSCAFRDTCQRCPGAGYRDTGSLYGPYRQACRNAVLLKEAIQGVRYAEEELPTLLRGTEFRQGGTAGEHGCTMTV